MVDQSLNLSVGAVEARGEARDTGKSVVSAGSVLGALASVTCCILPLVLFSLGAGGAWIGNLTALAPYQPYFIALTVVFLGSGFYMVYRKPKAAGCEPGSFCASPKSDRLTKTVLWIAAVMVTGSVAFNFLAPALLGV